MPKMNNLDRLTYQYEKLAGIVEKLRIHLQKNGEKIDLSAFPNAEAFVIRSFEFFQTGRGKTFKWLADEADDLVKTGEQLLEDMNVPT